MFGTLAKTGLCGPVRFFCGLALGLAAAAAPATELPVVTLKVGDHTVTAEVASTDATRSRGLMYRESLPRNHGMLFTFPEAFQYCFWMKNTPLPLTIAFIDAQGQIINLADMQPLSEKTHCALAPASYALEMDQGWFAKSGVRPGSHVAGLP